jgi:AcrR family transcriptional regulator
MQTMATDDPSEETSRPPMTRRRGAALERAILRAAIDEIAESGYAALTMDRVARRAGTNKNAIYRRWPNRALLGIAAYRELIDVEREAPDTGSLREDALALLRGANRLWASPAGDVLRSLLASVGDDPDLLAELREQTGDGGTGLWLTILGRAVARGEVPPEVLHPRAATVAIVLLRNEYITRGYPNVPERVLTEIVDEVFLPLMRGRGLRADPAPSEDRSGHPG